MSGDDTLHYQEQLDAARQFWDDAAVSFDDEPDHGLRDPGILAAWETLLRTFLSSNKGSILDVGSGTGSLSILLAGLGYKVTGIDLSPAMLSLAREKATASGQSIRFHVMDAAFIQLPPRQFDAIVCRHLLWTLSQPEQVLRRWVDLLKPRGRLVLVEGYWYTGAGLRAEDIVKALPSSLITIVVQNLSDQSDLWGSEITDERYVITADRSA
jgi:2-polyprenyl-3-methyl-5-hydroxy-6-metoxy-1,4-benzoquinol methylase